MAHRVWPRDSDWIFKVYSLESDGSKYLRIETFTTDLRMEFEVVGGWYEIHLDAPLHGGNRAGVSRVFHDAGGGRYAVDWGPIAGDTGGPWVRIARMTEKMIEENG